MPVTLYICLEAFQFLGVGWNMEYSQNVKDSLAASVLVPSVLVSVPAGLCELMKRIAFLKGVGEDLLARWAFGYGHGHRH